MPEEVFQLPADNFTTAEEVRIAPEEVFTPPEDLFTVPADKIPSPEDIFPPIFRVKFPTLEGISS
jgi:hypothetical protein